MSGPVPHVLIVDDNQLSRSMMGYLLKNYGCLISEAANGKESLKELMFHNFDLIVLDWKMPLMDGYQTLIESDDLLKKRYSREKIPVLIYTNSQLSELDIPHCNHLSVKAAISKKMTPFQQLRKIKKTLNQIFPEGHS